VTLNPSTHPVLQQTVSGDRARERETDGEGGDGQTEGVRGEGRREQRWGVAGKGEVGEEVERKGVGRG